MSEAIPENVMQARSKPAERVSPEPVSTTEVLTSQVIDAAFEQSPQRSWTERYQGAVMNTFGTPQRVLVRGQGVHVWDEQGNRYLDLLGGIAVNALGHAHPTLTGAITAQLSTLGHISNFFASPTQIAAAERLLQLVEAPEGSALFFTNSGTEAIEAAFKIARKHGTTTEPVGRHRILSLEGAFHGRSFGALALTAKAAYRDPFGEMAAAVEHLPFGDAGALRRAIGPDVAALFIEPIQGEAGVQPHPPGYLKLARELTRQHGALLVVDEVQTGIGRTGHWLALQDPTIGEGVEPDLVALAKGLGGGFPVGALIAWGQSNARIFNPGDHGSTFGGNPPAAAAILATLAVIERDGLLEHTRAMGAYLDQRIAQLAARPESLITGIRGRGLLRGITLAQPAATEFAGVALKAGFIVNAPNPSTIRIAPPLLITEAQLDEFLDAIPGIEQSLTSVGHSPSVCDSTHTSTDADGNHTVPNHSTTRKKGTS